MTTFAARLAPHASAQSHLRPLTGCGIISSFPARGIMPFRGSGALAASSVEHPANGEHLKN